MLGLPKPACASVMLDQRHSHMKAAAMATSPTVRPCPTESGAALLLAILMMTALVSFGVVYLEVSSAQATNQKAEFDRLRAVSLAEAGIAHAHNELALDPTFRGTLNETLGDGSYTVTITAVAGGLEIASEGTSVSNAAGQRSLLTEHTTPNLVGPLHLATNVSFYGGSMLEWSGQLLYGGQLRTFDTSIAVGGRRKAAGLNAPSVVIDFPAGWTYADTLLLNLGDAKDPVLLAAGSYDGTFYCDADLEVTAPVTIKGCLMVEGSLTINGAGAVTIVSGRHPMALAVGGTLTCQRLRFHDRRNSIR